MEMFERDVQPALDDYLAGAIDEPTFLAGARPWPNYAEDYRPVVQLAKREHLDVIAANVPRPLAARVSREGLEPVRSQRWMPADVQPYPGAYRMRFEDAMGDAGGSSAHEIPPDAMDRWYTAQVVKDEAMAESIQRWIEDHWPDGFVVHWCGKFHSDRRLGTVERLLRRRPDLKVGVVTTISGVRDPRDLSEEQRTAADYVWLVPVPASRGRD